MSLLFLLLNVIFIYIFHKKTDWKHLLRMILWKLQNCEEVSWLSDWYSLRLQHFVVIEVKTCSDCATFDETGDFFLSLAVTIFCQDRKSFFEQKKVFNALFAFYAGRFMRPYILWFVLVWHTLLVNLWQFFFKLLNLLFPHIFMLLCSMLLVVSKHKRAF